MAENMLKNSVLELYNLKKWKEILELNEDSTDEKARKLLWVWPEEKNLFFIKKIISEFGCSGISSIGCGCGLLEWIINESTGLTVIGYEVNQDWWESKYSNPKFITLHYVLNINTEDLNPEHALLFCYFNDRKAFQQYLKNYRGNLVLIIGPGKGSGNHTDPEPFNPDFGNDEWNLIDHQEIKNTKDYIAAYVKNHHN